jgi:maltooligosyltrehalose trehalohydrolase
MTAHERRELGAHIEGAGVRFGVFADAQSCSVELVDDSGRSEQLHTLESAGDGRWYGFVDGVGAGARYWFVVDGRRLPDPRARFLPDGVHGPAQVVASQGGAARALPARPLAEQVIYELHVGTFTEEGTFDAARERLPALADLGITTIELMPVAAFAGQRGWGYDGVALFAPHAAYGTPAQLRRLVDAAHDLGLGVLLDVVYNHFGPSGNYLAAFSPRYFSDEFQNAWGKAPSFAEPELRQLVLDNARYWLTDFDFDGLRLDATHAIFDRAPRHVLAEVAELAHRLTPRRVIIAEDERNQAALVTELGLDALWADDFHHQTRVTLTGERSGYFAAYEPSVEGIADAINHGWLYSGQPSPLTGEPRGTRADALAAESLLYCIQNHDQVGNRALGDRWPLNEGFRAASLLLLFLPMTPLLFMGQEWGAASPFLYFTDHDAELGALVSAGRRREFASFPEFSDPERQRAIPDPQALETFLASKLRWSEREQGEHAATLRLYRAALGLRKTDPVLKSTGRAELSAQAGDGVLLVRRQRGEQQRVLLMSFVERDLPLAELAQKWQLGPTRTLLRSSPDPRDALPPFGAALLCNEQSKILAPREVR